MFRHFTIFSFSIFLIFSLSIMFGSSLTFSEDAETDRSAQWYQAQYGTGPLGQTWMMGSFGPDFGIGEQGVRYQSVDPMTGSFVSYSVTSPGMGIGGPFAGYGGMFSPAALASYGPFAYGNNPQPMPHPVILRRDIPQEALLETIPTSIRHNPHSA